MSQIMEKTLASLPKLLSQSLTGGGNTKLPQRQSPLMDVQNFMKQIHKARSKSQEAAIIKSELQSVQQKLKNVDTMSSPALVRACFTKVIFSYQLGYNVSDLGVEAIKLAQRGHGFEKRLGYLVSSLILHSNHEVTILMTSTVLKDLKSRNMTDVCLALKVTGDLMGEESIPFLLPEVVSNLNHSQDLVREKALHCFNSLCHKTPELLVPEIPKLSAFLTSRDPGVLMAVTNIFSDLTSKNPARFVGLSRSFMHILDQINSRGFGSIYYYNMVALPWLQINLLKILSNLAQVDAFTYTHLEPMLKTLIEKTKVSVPISLALLVESIQTATKIQASDSLLQLCSRCIMKLMAPDSTEDMRYQGLGLLISLSKIKPSYTNQHQSAVIECLSSNDPAIQSRTTYLLYTMANSVNAKVICDKLFEQLKISNDLEFSREILNMLINIVETLSPNVEWYVSTYFQVLSNTKESHYIDKITDSLSKKFEQFHRPNEILDMIGLTNILEELLSELEKNSHEDPIYALRIKLLGVLVPLVSIQFNVERFFDIINQCCFESAHLNNSHTQISKTIMNCPGSFSGNRNQFLCSFRENDIIHAKIICVETVTKLVLAGCLDSTFVLQWLEKNNYKSLSLNSFLHRALLELEDVVRHPLDLRMRSKILFHADINDLDLSLSFLDPLVVQDLLNGGDSFKPKYLTNGEKFGSSYTLSESLSLHESRKQSLPSEHPSLGSEGKMAASTRVVKERWRDVAEGNDDDASEDDEDERFLFVDAETSVGDHAGKQQKELAEQLFAGLGKNDDSTELRNSPSDSGISSSGMKAPVKSQRNIWDDDDDDDDVDDLLSQTKGVDSRKSSFFGVDIHPFGVTKKISNKQTIWHDDDLDSSLQVAKNTKASNPEDASTYETTRTSLYNLHLQDIPSYSPTYFYHEADSADTIDGGSVVIKDGMSMEQESGMSIYSEFIDQQSPVMVSPEITASTVDTLTDSDPEGS